MRGLISEKYSGVIFLIVTFIFILLHSIKILASGGVVDLTPSPSYYDIQCLYDYEYNQLANISPPGCTLKVV